MSLYWIFHIPLHFIRKILILSDYVELLRTIFIDIFHLQCYLIDIKFIN